MVVILLLPPYTNNGCDGWSQHESSYSNSNSNNNSNSNSNSSITISPPTATKEAAAAATTGGNKNNKNNNRNKKQHSKSIRNRRESDNVFGSGCSSNSCSGSSYASTESTTSTGDTAVQQTSVSDTANPTTTTTTTITTYYRESNYIDDNYENDGNACMQDCNNNNDIINIPQKSKTKITTTTNIPATSEILSTASASAKAAATSTSTSTAAFYGTSHKQKNANNVAILATAWPPQSSRISLSNTFPPKCLQNDSISHEVYDDTEEYFTLPDDDDITNSTHTKFYPNIIPKPLRDYRAIRKLETIPEYPTIAAATTTAATTAATSIQKCTLCHDMAKANTKANIIKCKSKSKSKRKNERSDRYSTSKTKATNSSSSHSHSQNHSHSHSHSQSHKCSNSDNGTDTGNGIGTGNSNIKAAHQSTAFLNTNYTTNTTNYVRHVTRVNFYDIDTSQVEYDSKDDDDDDGDDDDDDDDDNDGNNNNNNNARDEDNNCDGKNVNLKANATIGKTLSTVKDNDFNTIAITKEEEWITKRKTELTTTRQIETHIKRQILFKDGKVIDDSGPMVSTNTTEDTDKQETETTEKRDLGLPTNAATTKPTKSTKSPKTKVGVPTSVAAAVATSSNIAEQLKSSININDNLTGIAVTKSSSNNNNKNNNKNTNSDDNRQEIDNDDDNDDGIKNENDNGVGNGNDDVLVKKELVKKPADGLVKESNEKRVVTHEEIDDYLETEDVQHYGDFSDKAYVKAIHSGVENVEEVLLSPEVQQELQTSIGKRVIDNNTKSYKTIDSEEIQKRSLLQDDGKIITEQKKITEHQVIIDKELSDKDIKSSVGSQDNLLTTKEANQRYFKQRDEQHMDLIEGGKVIGTEMRYAAETVQMENDHLLEKPDDWDSLSNRMRRMRRPYNKVSVHHQKTGLLLDRKDALTKRPLDFDREEETRKGETIKWLESHFGSESTASNDSRDDEIDLVEPTKRSYFNVTIKSNQNQTTPSTATANYGSYDRRHPLDIHESSHNESAQQPPPLAIRNNAKYYPSAGDIRSNHFSSKAFHDDLCATVERTQMRKTQQSSLDNYAKHDDIVQKPRHSISSQFLPKSRQNSKDNIDQLDEPSVLVNGSHTDLHYGILLRDREKHSALINTHNIRDEKESPIIPRKNPLRSYEHFNSLKRESGVQRQHQQQQQPVVYQSSQEVQTLDRPTAPQRRRSNDKKLRQQKSVSPTPKRPLPHSQEFFCEPPPDYSPPPPHSRSSSPCTDIRPGIITSHRYAQTLKSSEHYTNFSKKKPYQHTRFARDITPSPPLPQSPPKPQTIITARPTMMSSQTTQTTPSSVSAASTTPVITTHKTNRMGQVIGNSLRKLVNKFRSASVERKLKKSKNKSSRDSYPSSDYGHSRQHHSNHFKRDQLNQNEANSTTTYQQYNVIDSHIGVNGHHLEDDFEKDFSRPTANLTAEIGAPATSIATANATKHIGFNSQQTIKRTPERNSQYRNSAIDHSSNDETHLPIIKKNPKQRYYLGEDPYSSNLCGKENFPEIDGNRLRQELRQNGHSKNYEQSSSSNSYSYRNPPAQTLGRYQKYNRRISDSTPNLNNNNNNYRHTQTLPHKLTEKPTIHQYEIQKATITRVDNTLNNSSHRKARPPPPPPITTTTTATAMATINNNSNEQYHTSYHQMPGPLKPARSYPKSLNRSKSFSIHAINGMNGVIDNDAPQTIYMEKTNNNHADYTNSNSTQVYSKQQQTNAQLYNTWFKESPKTTLRSPSIVNLISRSQKDLSKLNTSEDCSDISLEYTNGRHIPGHTITLGKQLQQFDERRKQNAYTNKNTIIAPTNNSGKNNNNNSNNCSNRNGRYQLQPKRSFDSQSSIEINKDTACIIRREEYLREMLNGGGNNSTIIKVRNMDYRK